MEFIFSVTVSLIPALAIFVVADALANFHLHRLFFMHRLWDSSDKEVIINHGDVIVTFADGEYGFKKNPLEDEVIMCDRRRLAEWVLGTHYDGVIYGPMNVPSTTIFPWAILPSELMKKKIDSVYLDILKDTNSMMIDL